MKKCKKQIILFILGLFASQLSSQGENGIEPPFWWVGMEDTSLQLMLPDVTEQTDISIHGEYVTLDSLTRTESRYVFLHLTIDKNAKPGSFVIRFSQPNAEGWMNYELKERKVNSAQRMGFNSEDVVYLITPDRFANGDPSNDSNEEMREGLDRSIDYGRHGGDIQGVIDNLDYIADMGFTSIWLNPVLVNDMEKWSYHGYSTTNYYNVDPRFGSNELYKELCDKAQEKGIGIIMDQIANHCGSFHRWVYIPPFADWFNNQIEFYEHEADQFVGTNHRKTTKVDPYSAKIDQDQMTDGWFVKTMPDLNQRNPYLAKYLIQNSIWWIEYAGLHGVRQDTYSYPDGDFMRDWTCAILNEYPNFNIVGEEWIDDPSMISYWQRGKKNHDGYESCLPSMMDFPTMFDLIKALSEEESWGDGLIRLYENLASDYLYADPQHLMIFGDNHDVSRVAKLLGEDDTLIKMAMAYLLTIRGIPQIYYGTEIKMTHPQSDSHGAIRSDFPGGWEGDAVNAFTGENLSKDQTDFQNWMKRLLNWRKKNPVIHKGALKHYAPNDGVYVYFRNDEENKVMVILNKNTKPYNLGLSRFEESLTGSTRFQNVMEGTEGTLGTSLMLKEKGVQILLLLP